MALTRRELCILMPALMAAGAAVGEPVEHGAGAQTLPSKIYDYSRLPKEVAKGHNYIPIFSGKTYSGMPIEMHESEIAPGHIVHELYRHPGDELFLVREGLLEVEFNGKRSQVGPGSVAYIASNTEYAIRNTSKGWTRYFVILLGPHHPLIDRK